MWRILMMLGVLTTIFGCESSSLLIAKEPVPTAKMPRQSMTLVQGVVVVVIDTLRGDAFGCGESRAMPVLEDLVAQQGTCFTGAYAASSWTKPASASIDTGVVPTTHQLVTNVAEGVPEKYTQVRADVQMLPDYVRGAGGVSAFTTVNWVYDIPSVSDRYDFDFSPFRSQDPALIDTKTEEKEDENLVINTPVWLEQMGVEPGDLFLVRYQFMSPHWPYCPPTVDESQWIVEGVDLCGITDMQEIRNNWENPAFAQGLLSLYAEEAAYVGDLVGQLYRTYEEMGFADSTLFIITADHGEEFYEHGDFGHGSTVFHEQTHVPLAFIGTGIPRGKVVTSPVSAIDIVPTILASMERTTTPSDLLEGRNLLPLMRGMTSSPYRWVSQLMGQYGTLQGLCATAPDGEEWVYINDPIPNEQYLFKPEDVAQENNVSGEESYQTVEAWMASVNNKPMVAYDQWVEENYQ
ncbi:MAG: sulfatase-like hydrolase/transferase [Candidatus Uhrbacteria bacterium]|nr:sulfatase-like hydrolase/transferase [Candidatus Uhrbacteria bacterium]